MTAASTSADTEMTDKKTCSKATFRRGESVAVKGPELYAVSKTAIIATISVASDAPPILILRGGLRRATSVRPQRLAAVPTPDTAAQEAPGIVAPGIVAPGIVAPRNMAPPITVLRGGAAFRSAHTALLPAVQPPAIAVVRGTRPADLAKLAAPGPLVLRIRD